MMEMDEMGEGRNVFKDFEDFEQASKSGRVEERGRGRQRGV